MAGSWREAAERWLYLPELVVLALGLAMREEWFVMHFCSYAFLGVACRTAFVWGAYEGRLPDLLGVLFGYPLPKIWVWFSSWH